ncbi:putative quinol monooxygenase [Flavobacterium sp. JP2137]|uniref:putative quinol monooxygenase n=1 Tax=Flavobacterium sp. JP2137 TaxID=3414510 RepID=UPI003D2FE953
MKKTIIVRFSIKPEFISRIRAASKDLLEQTRQEAGCLAFNFYQCTENPSDFIFYEKFKDREAVQLHNEAIYVQDFLAVIKESSQIDMDLEVFD